ncbi:MAG: TonB-dependent receptor [Pseudomonadales bacterium]|nr:TonB-dependent receptor [Pseudomonadales bacterium]
MNVKRICQYIVGFTLGGISSTSFASEYEDLFSMSLDELLNVRVSVQKRDENLKDVPVSVRVITNSQIKRANITRIEELSHVSPSLVFDKRIDFTKSSFKIRGIGTQVFGAGVEPSVATMVDGVVMARSGAGLDDLVDIERIEILNGPQSTLYGKNASAGLIHIITPKPNTENFEHRINSRITDDNEELLSLVATGPLSDSLAYRFSAHARSFDGNVQNRFNGHDLNGYETQGAKAKLLWQSTDSVEWLLTADYSKQKTSTGVRVLRVDSDSILTDPAAIGFSGIPATAGNITGIAGSSDNDEVNLDRDPYADTDAWGVSLETLWELNGFTLTNIAAFRRWGQENDRDNDQTQLPFSLMQQENLDVEWFSEELRLASPLNASYDYVLGLYYYESENYHVSGDDRTFSNSPYNVEFNLARNTIENKNAAVFGQLNWHFNDDLTTFLGLRYLYDKVDGHLSRRAFSQNNSFLGDGLITDNRDVEGVSNSHSVREFTGKSGIKLDLNENSMAYAFYARGFKGEGFNTSFKFNVDLFSNEEPVAPETSDTLEIGAKGYWFDNTLRVNAALFYTQYDNLQLILRDLVNNRNVLGSVPEVITKGVELDFSALLGRGFNIEGAVSYTDASYKDFSNANCYSGQSAVQGCVSLSGGNVQDLSGKTLANVPRWRASLGVRYDFVINNNAFLFNTHWRVQSDANLDAAGNPVAEQRGYGVVDMGLGTVRNRGLNAKLFVNNVFDKQYINGVTINGNAGGDLLLQLLPRDFRRFAGLTIEYTY